MRTLSWDLVKEELDLLEPEINEKIAETSADIGRRTKFNNNEEALSQLLANLNYYVLKLGEFQAQLEPLKMWTEKRYEIEKGLETVRIVREDKKAVNYAGNAKYEKVQLFLDTMVSASAMYLRVQNARSSARDATEGIRSRISQIKGAVRSS